MAGYSSTRLNLLKAYKYSNPNAQVTPDNVRGVFMAAQAAMKQYEREKFRGLVQQDFAQDTIQAMPQSSQGATALPPSAQLNAGIAAPTADAPASDAEEAPVAPHASASAPTDDAAPAPQDPAVASGQEVSDLDEDDGFEDDFSSEVSDLDEDDDFEDDFSSEASDLDDNLSQPKGRLAQKHDEAQARSRNDSRNSFS